MKQLSNRNFDETVEVAFRLGVDPRKADQMLRGTVSLPAGTGKDVRVAVFAAGDAAREAEEAGADVVGADDLVDRIQRGFLDFDVAIATPDLMGQVGKLGRVLGPRGLMPNPKTGTVTNDVGKTVARVQGRQGRVPHRPLRQRARADRQGQLPGRGARQELRRGARRDRAGQARGGEGPYIKGITTSSTMGPGVKISTDARVEVRLSAVAKYPDRSCEAELRRRSVRSRRLSHGSLAFAGTGARVRRGNSRSDVQTEVAAPTTSSTRPSTEHLDESQRFVAVG